LTAHAVIMRKREPADDLDFALAELPRLLSFPKIISRSQPFRLCRMDALPGGEVQSKNSRGGRPDFKIGFRFRGHLSANWRFAGRHFDQVSLVSETRSIRLRAWHAVRVLPAPPRSRTFAEISSNTEKGPQLAGFFCGGSSLRAGG
jgi:hypothetical protein